MATVHQSPLTNAPWWWLAVDATALTICWDSNWGFLRCFCWEGHGSALEMQASYKVWLMQFKQHGQYREPISDCNSDDISSVS